jgi:hypothetical protein
MNGGESSKTAEIGPVERKDVGDAMGVHGRGQPSIVYLHTGHGEIAPRSFATPGTPLGYQAATPFRLQ